MSDHVTVKKLQQISALPTVKPRILSVAFRLCMIRAQACLCPHCSDHPRPPTSWGPATWPLLSSAHAKTLPSQGLCTHCTQPPSCLCPPVSSLAGPLLSVLHKGDTPRHPSGPFLVVVCNGTGLVASWSDRVFWAYLFTARLTPWNIKPHREWGLGPVTAGTQQALIKC